MAKKRGGNKKSNKTLVALALWLLALLVLVILFFANQKRIFSNLKTTDFFSRAFGKTPAFVENAPEVESSASDKNDVAPLESSEVEIEIIENSPDREEVPAEEVEEKEPEKEIESETVIAEEVKTEPAKTETVKTESAPKEEKPAVTPVVPPRTMNLKLYFMVINSDGSVSRREVTRSMKKSDSPLVDAVHALIEGPTPQESESGCRTLLSAGTRLIGASVRNGVATLNFSSEFEFNQYGVEGTRGQLQQLVYTATAFPTVESVQFLVDGEKKDYLGSEGVWIGTPLNRNSF